MLVAASLGGLATWQVYRWLTTWPARLELRTESGHFPEAFSPDGSRLLTRGAWGVGTFLWDLRDGRQEASWPVAGKRSRLPGALSPDGRTLASPWHVPNSLKNFSIDLIDVASGQARSTFDSPLEGLQGLRFREGGRVVRLVASGRTSGYRVVDVDVAGGQVVSDRPLTQAMPTGFLGPSALSADGRLLAVSGPTPGAVGGSPALVVWDLDRDREVFRLPTPARAANPVRAAFSPDRKRLALGFADGSVELWDVEGRSRIWSARDHDRGFSPEALAFSPDGSILASTATFRGLTLSFGLVEAAFAAAFRERGRQNQDELILFDAADGRPLLHAGNYGHVVFSPDGKSLATSHEDEVVRIHDVPKGR